MYMSEEYKKMEYISKTLMSLRDGRDVYKDVLSAMKTEIESRYDLEQAQKELQKTDDINALRARMWLAFLSRRLKNKSPAQSWWHFVDSIGRRIFEYDSSFKKKFDDDPELYADAMHPLAVGHECQEYYNRIHK